MSSHTTRAQEQQFWSQPEKYNGLNGNFLAFLCEVLKEFERQMGRLNEKSRMFKIIERAQKYIQTIYIHNLSSAEEIRNNKDIQGLRTIIKYVPLPIREDKNKRSVTMTRINPETGAQETYELDSDYECGLTPDVTGWPKGWCDTVQERFVSNYIKNVFDAAITGAAMEVVSNMGMSRDRTGFDTVERLAEVYGRNAAHISMIPNNFVWGKNSLVQDWYNYKHKIESTEYLRLHSSNEPMVVHLANKGFDNYSNSFRILDHTRSSVGGSP